MITSFILLEKQTDNNLFHYKKIDQLNDQNILHLYEYLQYQYSSEDIEAIINNIAAFDETSEEYKHECEESFHESTQTALCLDFKNPNDIYLVSNYEYEKFMENDSSDDFPSNFIDMIKKNNQLKYIKLSRKNLYQLLFKWNKILTTMPNFILFNQNSINEIFINSFKTEKESFQFITNKN